MSSDKLSNVQEPLCALNLDIQNENGSKIVNLDLSKDELKDLINSLENASRVSIRPKNEKKCI